MGLFGFYTLKFHNFRFGVVWECLDFTFDVLEFEFYPKILEIFGFYSIKFRGVGILHFKVSKFWNVKSKHHQILESKIQILKC